MTHVWNSDFCAADGAYPDSGTLWIERHIDQLEHEFKARYPTSRARDFVGWCFKQYERYCENCNEVYQSRCDENGNYLS